nr:hypothetical protein [Tanacetum cinerariifolium]
MNQPQPVVSTQGTHRSIPRAYRTPTLTASPQGKKRKQSARESKPEIHKDKPKYVNDDDDKDDEKVDDEEREFPKRIEEDYHSIKNDIPLVSVYTTEDVRIRGMLIPDAFLTAEIRVTADFKEYETVFMTVDVPMNQPQSVVSTQGTHSHPISRFIKLIIADLMKKFPEFPKRIEDDYHSIKNDIPLVSVYTTEDVRVRGMLIPDAFLTAEIRLEPEIHKDKPKYVNDDDDKDDEKVDDEERGEMGSLKTRTEKMQTPIPRPPRSPRTILSSDKNITQELMKTVLKRKFEKYSTSNTSCREDEIHSHHDDHQEDDAPPEREKRVKRHKASKSSKSARGSSSKHSAKDSTTYISKQQQQQQEWDAWVEETIIDKDKVILKDETPELITKLQDVDKRVPTIFDYEIMRATLNDALSNQFTNAEEYAYHLEQTTNFMENQIV